MTEQRLEPYRGANVLEFMRAVALHWQLEIPVQPWRDAYSSEDDFEVFTREFGSPECGVRLEERNGVDPRTGCVNQERVKAVLYGVEAATFELETVDGVFQRSYATLRVETLQHFPSLWRRGCHKLGESYEEKQQRVLGAADTPRQSGGWERNLGNAVTALEAEITAFFTRTFSR